jgi:hypothetical protein
MSMKHVQIILLKKAVKPNHVIQLHKIIKLLNKNEIYLNIIYIIK